MATWLFKEEPNLYSYSDLVRDGETVWDGVKNALAQKHLRQVRAGDRVLLYHTGNQKAVVGEMRVKNDPSPAPDSDDPRMVVVVVEPVRAFERAVSLAEIKSDPALAAWDLVRLPRLSVVSVTEAQWRRVEELGRADR